MDNSSLDLVKRVASDIDAKVYKETSITFKTQAELLAAMNLLRPMLLFSVVNMGRVHRIEFRSVSDMRKASEILKGET